MASAVAELIPFDRDTLARDPELSAAERDDLISIRRWRHITPFRVEAPLVVPDRAIEFPRLLSGTDQISTTAAELESELSLILEMAKDATSTTKPVLYSVMVLDPVPFEASDELKNAVPKECPELLSDVRMGYLVHNELYALEPRADIFHAVISTFLGECRAVEVKLANAEQPFRRVRVELAQ